MENDAIKNDKRQSIVTILIVVCGLITVSMRAEAQSSGAGDNKHTVQVTAELIDSQSGRYYLRMKLKNDASVSLSMAEWRLPWRNRSNVKTLVETTGMAGHTVREVFEIDDPVLLPQVTLGPGEERMGDIDLNRRHPDLNSIVRQQDVVVFWFYDYSPGPREESEYSGGWFVIRRHKRN